MTRPDNLRTAKGILGAVIAGCVMWWLIVWLVVG